MSEDKINIELSKSEALILFEFLSRFSNDEKLEIQNRAEERVLWNMCSDLESILVEPFEENYIELLAEAGKHVMKKPI